MAAVRIINMNKEIPCRDGDCLRDVLIRAGIYVESPCGGNGVCGKCRVRMVGSREITKGQEARLACMVRVTGNLDIVLDAPEQHVPVLAEGFESSGKKQKDGNRRSGSFGDVCGVYGLAVDVGTTTAAAVLMEGDTGREIAAATALNGQRKYGADVLTRIGREMERPEEGRKELQRAVIETLNQLIEKVGKRAGIRPDQIQKIAVSANCVMAHMLLGEDARSLGRAPYKPVFTKARRVSAAALGLNADPNAAVYCLPQASAYVGADAAAGVYMCALRKKDKALLADIGTNGELVLSYNGRLYGCSCAAGPALEGMNIHFGMTAADGAVEEVKIEFPKGKEEALCKGEDLDTWVRLKAIGDARPKGFCGSGILSAVTELLKIGVIKPNGALIKPDELPEGDGRRAFLIKGEYGRAALLCRKPKLFITQKDIRQVQLAKGAVLSGIRALLGETGLKAEELKQVFVAGQFGRNLREADIFGIGMFPEEARGKIIYAGNTSLTGAKAALLSEEARMELETLTESMEYIELSGVDNYERIFAESMVFPKK